MCFLEKIELKKIICALVFALGIALTTPSTALAHSGRTDSQGGHNCRVGSCAGTYHCHQALGPACGLTKSGKKKK